MENKLWKPLASQKALKARALMYQQIRLFFQKNNVMEVDTPVFSPFGNTDPSIESMSSTYQGQGIKGCLPLYLQTSPEFFMKRLLAAGSGSIYQLAKAFRNGELGRYHHPEFTILEWYRVDYSMQQLMEEVAILSQLIFGKKITVSYYSYHQLFLQQLGVDINKADSKALKAVAGKYQIAGVDTLILDKNEWLDYLLSHYIIPQLNSNELSFIYHFPAEQASLARLTKDCPPVAERFEMIYCGLELANGFHELDNPEEQQVRFEAENNKRRRLGLKSIPLDRYLIDALSAGLPDCSGVALGVDRLLMLKLKEQTINKVLSFSSLH